MEFWEKPQKRKDDLLLKQLRKIRNQRGKRVTDTKPLLDAIIAEICGLSNVRYNWSETQCARFFERAIYHYLHGHEYLDQLLAASALVLSTKIKCPQLRADGFLAKIIQKMLGAR